MSMRPPPVKFHHNEIRLFICDPNMEELYQQILLLRERLKHAIDEANMPLSLH